jgi:hypothetical protein
MNHTIQRLIAFERSQIILAAVSAIAGAVLGWLLPLAFADPKRLDLWLVSIAAILVILATASAYSLSAITKASLDKTLAEMSERVTNFGLGLESKMTTVAEESTRLVAVAQDLARHQAELVPRERIYKVMAECIRGAQSEVAIITYMMADWETGKRTFAPDGADTPHRGEFYDAIYEAIKNPKVQYIRVWQIPAGKIDVAKRMLAENENHRKECALIDEISKNHPEQARLVLTNQLTTASFILIDRKHLFFNVDFFEPEENVWYSPYMLFIKDATGDTFRHLQSVIVRLTGK